MPTDTPARAQGMATIPITRELARELYPERAPFFGVNRASAPVRLSGLADRTSFLSSSSSVSSSRLAQPRGRPSAWSGTSLMANGTTMSMWMHPGDDGVMTEEQAIEAYAAHLPWFSAEELGFVRPVVEAPTRLERLLGEVVDMLP
jgi:hypothetical protein